MLRENQLNADIENEITEIREENPLSNITQDL